MRSVKFLLVESLVVMLFPLLLQPSPVLSSSEIPPGAVTNAAEHGVRIFVKDPLVKNLQRFGLASKEQVDNAALGKGFRVFSIPPEGLLDFASSRDLDSLVRASNTWQFLIVADGKAASLLTVDFFNNQWTPVSIGGSGLAKEVEALFGAWPSSAGYSYRFIRVYQAKSDFMEILEGENAIGVVPFTSARIATGLEGGFDPLDLRDPREVLSKLGPVVKTNLK